MYDYPTQETLTHKLSAALPKLVEARSGKGAENFQDILELSNSELIKPQEIGGSIKMEKNAGPSLELSSSPLDSELDIKTTDVESLQPPDIPTAERAEPDHEMVPALAPKEAAHEARTDATSLAPGGRRESAPHVTDASSVSVSAKGADAARETLPWPVQRKATDMRHMDGSVNTAFVSSAFLELLFVMAQDKALPARPDVQIGTRDLPISKMSESPAERSAKTDDLKPFHRAAQKKETSPEGTFPTLEHDRKSSPIQETPQASTPPQSRSSAEQVTLALPSVTQLAESAVASAPDLHSEAILNDPKTSVEGGLAERANTVHRTTLETAVRPPLPVQVDSRGVVQQISASLTASTNGQIEITLSPEELGQVRLQLTQQDGRAIMIVAADRVETLDLLRRNAEMLLSDFAQMGYDGLDLQFQDQPSQSNSDQDAADEALLDIDPAPAPTVTPHQRYTLSDRLDLRL